MLTIGVSLYFVLLLINEILFEMEYLFNKSKPSQNKINNMENELKSKKMEEDVYALFNYKPKGLIPTKNFAQKIIPLHKRNRVEISNPNSIQYHKLQWLKKNKKSF